jgi:NADPH:quinone reductase-like Zn-dependent oxidoreductase
MSHTIDPPASMRAYVGTPAGPELRRVPDPQPASNQALVQVEAFSINRGELGLFARRPEGWRPGQDSSSTSSVGTPTTSSAGRR